MAGALALGACGADDEPGDAAPERGQALTTTAPHATTDGRRAGRSREDEERAREGPGATSSDDRRDSAGGTESSETGRAGDGGAQSGRDGGRPAGSDAPALFGRDVEVTPAAPGSDECEAELADSTVTLPCEQAERFFGR